MKNIFTLSTIVLIALSLNGKADDKIKNNGKASVVPVEIKSIPAAFKLQAK